VSFELTETQRKNYSAIEWLLGDGPVGSGRTSLMALVFIRKAMMNLGSWVTVFDHYPSRHNKQHFYAAIRNVFNGQDTLDNYELVINFTESKIKIKYTSGLVNPYLKEK